MMTTLFDKYGGVPVITEIVRDFYKRMFRRPNLRRYFEGVEMEVLIMHQVQFISYVMGKPAAFYEGKDLKVAHASHGITKTSFVLALDLLKDALEHAGVTPEDVDTIIGQAKTTHDLIVTR